MFEVHGNRDWFKKIKPVRLSIKEKGTGFKFLYFFVEIFISNDQQNTCEVNQH